MTDYQQQQMTKIEQHAQLTREVVSLLGDSWSVKEYPERDNDTWWGRPDIVHTDGRSFDLVLADNGRVRVSANWPTQNGKENTRTWTPRDLYNPSEESPSITVALSRGPEVLVREIKRRFLPEFTRIWQRLTDRINEQNEFENGQAQAFARIREVCNLPDTPQHLREYSSHWYDSNGSYGDVVVNSADSVEVKIRSLTAEQAIAIVQLARRTT